MKRQKFVDFKFLSRQGLVCYLLSSAPWSKCVVFNEQNEEDRLQSGKQAGLQTGDILLKQAEVSICPSSGRLYSVGWLSVINTVQCLLGNLCAHQTDIIV